MRKKQDETPEDSSIFSSHKSAEQLKAEALETKQAKKEAKKAARLEKKNQPHEVNTYLKVMIGILVTIIVGVIIIVAYQNITGGKEPNDLLGHFYNTDDMPELSEEGIKGVIIEAYYTRDKHLALVLKLSNGLNTNHYLKSIEVSVQNEDGETIATGYTDDIKEDYYIEPMGYSTFTFYISPDYVQIPDDDLSDLTYEITTKGQVEDSSVLETTTVAADSEETTTTAA